MSMANDAERTDSLLFPSFGGGSQPPFFYGVLL